MHLSGEEVSYFISEIISLLTVGICRVKTHSFDTSFVLSRPISCTKNEVALGFNSTEIYLGPRKMQNGRFLPNIQTRLDDFLILSAVSNNEQ